jgi:predicted RNA polymerase sigma factor
MRLAAGRQQQAQEAYRQALAVSTDEEERIRLQEILEQAAEIP